MNELDYFTDSGITKRIEEEMTYQQAENIKLWRVEFGNTYERIGATWCDHYRTWQLSDGLGQKLCTRAAIVLHENIDDWKVSQG